MAKSFFNTGGVDLNLLAQLAVLEEQNKAYARQKQGALGRAIIGGATQLGQGLIQARTAQQQMEAQAAQEAQKQRFAEQKVAAQYAGPGQTVQIGSQMITKPKDEFKGRQVVVGGGFDPTKQEFVKVVSQETAPGQYGEPTTLRAGVGFTPLEITDRKRRMAEGLTDTQTKQYQTIKEAAQKRYQELLGKRSRPRPGEEYTTILQRVLAAQKTIDPAVKELLTIDTSFIPLPVSAEETAEQTAARILSIGK